MVAADSPVSASTSHSSTSGCPNRRSYCGQGEFDRGDRVVLVRRRRHMERVLELREPVPTPAIRQVPPWVVSNSLKSRACHTWFGPVGLRANSAFRSFANSRLRHLVPVCTRHRPDLPVTPRRLRPAHASPPAAERHPSSPGLRPAPFGGCSCRALACQRRQVRSGMSISLPQNLAVDMPASTDHLEVLEGPKRPSADFFHTRISTAASPSAWVSSATAASVLAPGSRARCRETRLPGLEEIRLPPADRLLADLLAPGRLGDRHLAGGGCSARSSSSSPPGSLVVFPMSNSPLRTQSMVLPQSPDARQYGGVIVVLVYEERSR